MATELDNYLLAPESGLFETLVDLGQRVVGRASRSAGCTSSSAPTGEPEVILSKTDGIVCVVRAIATTEQGDNVVVVGSRGRPLGARLTVQTLSDRRDAGRRPARRRRAQPRDARAADRRGGRGGVRPRRLPGDVGDREQRQPRGDAVSPSRHDGRIARAIGEQANAGGIVVSYGFCELHRGTHYNTSALVGPDGLIGLQRKVHASSTSSSASGRRTSGRCLRPRLLHGRHRDLPRQRLLRELAHPCPEGRGAVLLPHANRTMPAGGGSHSFDGREREAGPDELRRAQESCSRTVRRRRGCTTSSPGTTASSPSSPTWSASTATAPTSGVPTSSRPTVDARAHGARPRERVDRRRARPGAARRARGRVRGSRSGSAVPRPTRS